MKPNTLTEDKKKSNKSVSPSRFKYLYNNHQLENGINFIREVVQNVTPSKSSAKSKLSSDNKRVKEHSKEPARNTKVEQTKTGRRKALATTPAENSVVQKAFGEKLK